MMATQIWCEMVCGDCSKFLAGMFTTGAIPRADLKRAATEGGAVFKGDDVFCSPACRETYLDEQRSQEGLP